MSGLYFLPMTAPDCIMIVINWSRRAAGLLSATKRDGAQAYKLSLLAAGPKSTATLEWSNKPFKVGGYNASVCSRIQL